VDLLLCVRLGACEIHSDKGLNSHDPGVMAKRNDPSVAGAELLLASVVHSYMHLSRYHIPRVVDLAAVGLYYRLY